MSRDEEVSNGNKPISVCPERTRSSELAPRCENQCLR